MKPLSLASFSALFSPFLLIMRMPLARNSQLDPSVFFKKIESLIKQIGIKLSSCSFFGVRNIVTHHHLFSRYLANL